MSRLRRPGEKGLLETLRRQKVRQRVELVEVSVGVFAFGGGPDKEAADMGVVGTGAGCGTGRGFAAVEITGSGIEADLSAALFA